jgi:hypothetical protein
MKKIAKAKSGTSLGMKSVKTGYDKNPGVTRADFISAAKMNAGKAKYGAKVAPKKRMKKAQDGAMLPEALVKAKSLKRGMMDIALGDDRKMSVDTTGYKKQRMLPDSQKDSQTYNYTISDKSGKVLQKDKLKSEMYRGKEDIVNDMVKGLESGKMKRPAFKSGGKMMAKKGASVKSSGMHKMPDGSMMKNSKMKSGGTVKAKTGIKKMMSGGKCKMGC